MAADLSSSLLVRVRWFLSKPAVLAISSSSSANQMQLLHRPAVVSHAAWTLSALLWCHSGPVPAKPSSTQHCRQRPAAMHATATKRCVCRAVDDWMADRLVQKETHTNVYFAISLGPTFLLLLQEMCGTSEASSCFFRVRLLSLVDTRDGFPCAGIYNSTTCFLSFSSVLHLSWKWHKFNILTAQRWFYNCKHPYRIAYFVYNCTSPKQCASLIPQ